MIPRNLAIPWPLQFIIYSAAIAGTSSELFLLRERANYSTPRVGLQLAQSSLNYLTIDASNGQAKHILDSFTTNHIYILSPLWSTLQLFAWSSILQVYKLSLHLLQTLIKLLLNISQSNNKAIVIPQPIDFPHTIGRSGLLDSNNHINNSLVAAWNVIISC